VPDKFSGFSDPEAGYDAAFSVDKDIEVALIIKGSAAIR